MYERFTDRASKVMQLANQEAQRAGAVVIEPIHLLIGLLKENGVAFNIFQRLGVDLTLAQWRDRLVSSGTAGKTVVMPNAPSDHLPMAPETKWVVDESVKCAAALKYNYVGTEHLLMGLLAVESPAKAALNAVGVTACAVEREILALTQMSPTDAKTAETKDFLASILVDVQAVTKGETPPSWKRPEPSPVVLQNKPPVKYWYAIEDNGMRVELGADTLAELDAMIERYSCHGDSTPQAQTIESSHKPYVVTF